MPVLLRDQETLERSEEPQRQPDHQRNPQDGMDPIGRREGELDEKGEADDDEADDHHDEDRRAIAGVGE